ncbi:MAG: hypothetical protein RL354_1532 [Planctomycetota bacterium]
MLFERTIGTTTILRSTLLDAEGFAHGFSTRLGGVSAAPFDSLNLQSIQANARIAETEARDSEDALRENHARFQQAAGISRDRAVADASQVHGCTVVCARETLATRIAADAITSEPGSHAVLIRVADCVPILIADPHSGAVAAVHAGWRGVVAKIAPAAVAALRELGCSPASLVAAVGPCISARHFEIGPEVADALVGAELAPSVVAPGVHGPRHHADLVHALRLQLERCGLAVDRIDADPPCTFADRARFHSYRRDGAASGRLAAIIAPR